MQKSEVVRGNLDQPESTSEVQKPTSEADKVRSVQAHWTSPLDLRSKWGTANSTKGPVGCWSDPLEPTSWVAPTSWVTAYEIGYCGFKWAGLHGG